MITAVIPAYNEEARIGAVVRAAAAYVDEVLVIDDGSTDGTSAAAQEAGATAVRLEPNQGYIAAIKAGFQHARGDVVVTLDGDGELPPDAIPALVQPILDGQADMVQGARGQVPRPSEWVLTGIARLVAPAGDTGTGMRALRTDLARSLSIRGECICGVLTLEVLTRGGRVMDVPIRMATVDKPRKIAWYHGRQFIHVLRSTLGYVRTRHARSGARGAIL